MEQSAGPDPKSKNHELSADLEDQVLLILEGDDSSRDSAIEAFLQRHPDHALQIRNWLVAAGAIEDSPQNEEPLGTDQHQLPYRLDSYVLLEVMGCFH